MTIYAENFQRCCLVPYKSMAHFNSSGQSELAQCLDLAAGSNCSHDAHGTGNLNLQAELESAG